MDNKKIDRHDLVTDESYKLIPIIVESVVVNADQRTFIILSNDDKKVACELNSYEASMLTFFAKYYHENSHIQTIYQAFFNFLKMHKTNVTEIVIESKVGDVIYCSVKFTDNKLRDTFTILSLNDGVILSILSKLELFIVQNVLDNMDSIDDWDYENIIIDDDDED